MLSIGTTRGKQNICVLALALIVVWVVLEAGVNKQGNPDVEFGDSREKKFACGVVVGVFGNRDSKYTRTAAKATRRILEELPKPGWCRMEPSLRRIPVFWNTDLSLRDVRSIVGKANDEYVEYLHVWPSSKFESIRMPALEPTSEWYRLGDPLFQWYHCQIFKVSPFTSLMLYLDADVGICNGAQVSSLFRAVPPDEGDDGDIYLQRSTWMGGYGMTHGDRHNPHPRTVMSPKEKRIWANTPEANNGAVLMRMNDRTAQFAHDFCSELKRSFQWDDCAGDQYAFRAAIFNNRNSITMITLRDDMNRTIGIDVEDAGHTTNNSSFWHQPQICRGSGSSCATGCRIIHGWGALQRSARDLE